MAATVSRNVNIKIGGKAHATQSESKAKAPVAEEAKQSAAPKEEAKPTAFQLKIPGKNTPVSFGKSEAAAISETNQAPAASSAVEAEPEEPAIPGVIQQQPANTGISYPGQPETVPASEFAAFMDSKRILHECLDNKEMIGYALRRVMTDLKMHPELGEWLLPEDCGAMVRGLRESYSVTLAIKEKKSTKRKKKADVPGIDIDDLKDMLVDL